MANNVTWYFWLPLKHITIIWFAALFIFRTDQRQVIINNAFRFTPYHTRWETIRYNSVTNTSGTQIPLPPLDLYNKRKCVLPCHLCLQFYSKHDGCMIIKITKNLLNYTKVNNIYTQSPVNLYYNPNNTLVLHTTIIQRYKTQTL